MPTDEVPFALQSSTCPKQADSCLLCCTPLSYSTVAMNVATRQRINTAYTCNGRQSCTRNFHSYNSSSIGVLCMAQMASSGMRTLLHIHVHGHTLLLVECCHVSVEAHVNDRANTFRTALRSNGLALELSTF